MPDDILKLGASVVNEEALANIRAITASPSIRNDDAWMRLAASTIAGKRSAQSWPLRVKQRTRAIPAHHQPIAIVLDFVDPQWAGGGPGHL
jgi:hypothetical protein